MTRHLPGTARSLVLAAFLALFGFGPGTPRAAAQQPFLRGDINNDGIISVSDTLMLNRHLFLGDLAPTCLDAADTWDDGLLNLSDAIELLNAVFLGGAPIAPPFPEVGVDPTDDEDFGGEFIPCEVYVVEPPSVTEDLIDLGDVEGSPGETVEIPVYITNAEEVEAFQLVVEYDPAVFQPVFSRVSGGGGAFPFSFDGTFYENPLGPGPRDFGGAGSFHCQILAVEGTEGIFVSAYIPALAPQDDHGYLLPPGDGTLVFKLKGRIDPGAAEGTTVSLEPTNGENGEGVGPFHLRNELTHRGEARFASIFPQTEGGILKIVPDQTFFRADSDMNGDVALNDAVVTLNYLFLGAGAPSCFDAADADDSGALNITDPVLTLTFLYLGGTRLPPPYPARGRDPSIDGLDCLGRTS
jgi:hypothetical protein